MKNPGMMKQIWWSWGSIMGDGHDFYHQTLICCENVPQMVVHLMAI